MSSTQEEGNESNPTKKSPSIKQADGDDTTFFGPALPPQLLKKPLLEGKEIRKVYGLMLPSDISEKEKLGLNEITLSTSESRNERLIGPELPEHIKSTAAMASDAVEEANGNYDDADCNADVGPSANLMATGDIVNYYKFVNTESEVKKDTGETSTKRESWMTELPQQKAAKFGLFPRHFRSKIPTEKECDSSVWTDTPSDKEKRNQNNKNDHKEILKIKRLQERDREMEKLAIKAAKKLRKKESLLEMHMKKIKKKKKKEAKKREKEGVKEERRPFDRNIDLQIRKFDESHKRAIFNKSQFLNDRFASGESKFL